MELELLDIDGLTYEEWAVDQFEYEFCAECGGDGGDHTGILLLGHWFAVCRTLEFCL
jgi:hypothetical protein